MAGDASAMAAEAAALGGEEAPPDGAAPPSIRSDPLREAWRWAEQASEAYLDAAEAGRDEKEVRRLQSLAERAIARVAMLRHAGVGRDRLMAARATTCVTPAVSPRPLDGHGRLLPCRGRTEKPQPTERPSQVPAGQVSRGAG